MPETSISLSSQISSLIDISRQTLEEVRKLEKRLQDLVFDIEKRKCLTSEEVIQILRESVQHRCPAREELLSFFPLRQRLLQSIKLPQPETKS